MEQGLIGVDLGGHVCKKRISLPGRGKRGGARSIIAYKTTEKAFFIFGFAKSERANMNDEELKMAKALAKELIAYDCMQLDKLIVKKKLIEVDYDG